MQRATLPTEKLDRWRVSMIVAWFAGSFGMVFFARDLQFVVLGWPLSFWFASQGIVLMFVLQHNTVMQKQEKPYVFSMHKNTHNLLNT